ncbi:MAG: DNA primase small subunit domain-containing protein [Candidatus Woesearchaeota archaeon]
MIHLSTLLTYYKREDIQKTMVEHAKNKEVAVRFNDQFGKRPDVLNYPRDILEFAKQGATSFHASEELWSNPMQLNPMMQKSEIEALRTGWDLVLDIDCQFIEYSKVAADLVAKTLKKMGIKSCSIKFSGNKGFHIGVPYEAFPEKIGSIETRLMFPEAARRIAFYIKEMIKKPLGEAIMKLEKNDFSAIMQKTGKKQEEIRMKSGETLILNVEPFLAIDTLLISSRHLYRMPYSLHEKSGLVSLPIKEEEILSFSKESAMPSKVKAGLVFIDRKNVKKNEAALLLTEAMDFSPKIEQKASEEKEYDIPEEAIPEKFFPPCILKLLEGVDDGRKRSLFILSNFLRSCGWDFESIEKRLKEWNLKNKQPLKDVYIVGQLRYQKYQKKAILPPNCDNKAYYSDMGIKCDSAVCRVRNPVNYARRRAGTPRKKSNL